MVDIFTGKEEEAKKSLEKLRGSNHMEIIDAELFRISINLKMMKKDEEVELQNSKKYTWKLLTDVGFLRPFGTLLFTFCVGLEWTGLVAIAFYIVPFLM